MKGTVHVVHDALESFFLHGFHKLWKEFEMDTVGEELKSLFPTQKYHRRIGELKMTSLESIYI